LTNTKDEEPSLNRFYMLCNASRASNNKSRLLSLGVNGDIGLFEVSRMNIELSLSDHFSFEQNKTILEKENKIRSFWKTFDLDDNVQAQQKFKGIKKRERNTEKNQKNPVEGMVLFLEQMNELYLQEEKIHNEDQIEMKEIQEHAQLFHEEDQMRMQAMQEYAQLPHKEDQMKMQTIQEHTQQLLLHHEGDQIKMQAIQEHAQVFHEEDKIVLIHEVKHLKEEMNILIVEMVVIMVCCMGRAIAVLHHLKI
jgi:hypothetical protein